MVLVSGLRNVVYGVVYNLASSTGIQTSTSTVHTLLERVGEYHHTHTVDTWHHTVSTNHVEPVAHTVTFKLCSDSPVAVTPMWPQDQCSTNACTFIMP